MYRRSFSLLSLVVAACFLGRPPECDDGEHEEHGECVDDDTAPKETPVKVEYPDYTTDDDDDTDYTTDDDDDDTSPPITTTTPTEFTTWTGTESLDMSLDAAPDDPIDCHLVWATHGERVVPPVCNGCEFQFDIDFTFDAKESSDNGELPRCSGMDIDLSVRWGWYPLRGLLGYEIGGEVYGMYGSYADRRITYGYGYADYPYGDEYVTYLNAGEATLQ